MSEEFKALLMVLLFIGCLFFLFMFYLESVTMKVLTLIENWKNKEKA